jgi:hypothetical protein
LILEKICVDRNVLRGKYNYDINAGKKTTLITREINNQQGKYTIKTVIEREKYH